MLDDQTPLTEEESALLALAGWRHAGGQGGIDGEPLRLYFRHDTERRAVVWTRAEARAEVARIRGLWVQLPALLVAVEAARGEEAALRRRVAATTAEERRETTEALHQATNRKLEAFAALEERGNPDA